MTGKGSVNHNSRVFHAENTDPERTKFNHCYANENIKEVYHTLFDDAVIQYNDKQTRNDRKIDDYYEKIRTGKQEKLFHEIIVQVGNLKDMSAVSENGKLAEKILDVYMQKFRERNPNLYVFSAYLHMDEATPHLHIDFVPYTTDSNRGLDTRVSMKKALENQGFKGGTRKETERNQWVCSEKEHLAEVMLTHSIEWEQKNTQEKHLSVYAFEKKMRSQEVTDLEQKVEIRQLEIQQLQERLSNEKSSLQEVKTKKTKLENIDSIATKNTILNSSKIVVDKIEFDDLKTLAKKQIVSDSKERQFMTDNKRLHTENVQLKQENESQKQEIHQYKSIRNQLNVGKLQAEIDNLKRFIDKMMIFIGAMGLEKQLNHFMGKNRDKER